MHYRGVLPLARCRRTWRAGGPAKLDALRVAELTGDIPQNVNFALQGGIARNFLDAHQVYYNSAASTVQLSGAEIAEIAKKFTVLVECKN